jgi:archaellum component FlaC
MNRILLISLIIAIATAVFFKLQSDNRLLRATNAENKITTLETEIKGYKNAIQEYNDAQDRAGKTIEKVRTVVRNIKSDCDCWHTPVDDRVRNEIRKRKNNK